MVAVVDGVEAAVVGEVEAEVAVETEEAEVAVEMEEVEVAVEEEVGEKGVEGAEIPATRVIFSRTCYLLVSRSSVTVSSIRDTGIYIWNGRSIG